jgi:hypothetical protein
MQQAGTYGPKCARLAAPKSRNDHSNLLCLNQNIQPQI